jgi:hypothetical protein
MQPGVRIKLCIAFLLCTFPKPSTINPHPTKKKKNKVVDYLCTRLVEIQRS